MADHIYIKGLDEMSGYPPYKVYDEDDWMSVMWNDAMHDLNIWWDDIKDAWRWTIYPLHKNADGTWYTDARKKVADGDAVVLEDYEGH